VILNIAWRWLLRVETCRGKHNWYFVFVLTELYKLNIQKFCLQNVFICFVWILEQTNSYYFNLYEMSLLVEQWQCLSVFSVTSNMHCANTIIRRQRVSTLNSGHHQAIIQEFEHVPLSWPDDVQSLGSKLVAVWLFCSQSVCWLWLSAFISLYNINWLAFITKMECVYCVVRTQSLL
jgi:hypothetical protein